MHWIENIKALHRNGIRIKMVIFKTWQYSREAQDSLAACSFHARLNSDGLLFRIKPIAYSATATSFVDSNECLRFRRRV